MINTILYWKKKHKAAPNTDGKVLQEHYLMFWIHKMYIQGAPKLTPNSISYYFHKY